MSHEPALPSAPRRAAAPAYNLVEQTALMLAAYEGGLLSLWAIYAVQYEESYLTIPDHTCAALLKPRTR
jgi:hypothetical protein